MSNPTPETVITALQSLLTSALGSTVAVITQKQPPFDEMNMQPLINIHHAGDIDDWSGDGLPRTILLIQLWVWVQTKNPTLTPAVMLRSVTTPIRAALVPSGDDPRQTLNGNVYDCRIEGESQYFPSDLGEQGLAIIPVAIHLDATYP